MSIIDLLSDFREGGATRAQLDAARAARAAYRAGDAAPTSGVAHGLVQANLIALPADWAYDMLLYAQRNPRACPVLEVLDAGATEPVMAPGSDIRTDIPGYRIWRDGELAEQTGDAREAWAEHPDLVSFLIGCSFTFEAGLVDAGIAIRHQELGRNVPMYRTSRPCARCGRSQARGSRTRSGSRVDTPPSMALPSTSEIRLRSASVICRRPTSGIRPRCATARSRSSGPAG